MKKQVLLMLIVLLFSSLSVFSQTEQTEVSFGDKCGSWEYVARDYGFSRDRSIFYERFIFFVKDDYCSTDDLDLFVFEYCPRLDKFSFEINSKDYTSKNMRFKFILGKEKKIIKWLIWSDSESEYNVLYTIYLTDE